MDLWSLIGLSMFIISICVKKVVSKTVTFLTFHELVLLVFVCTPFKNSSRCVQKWFCHPRKKELFGILFELITLKDGCGSCDVPSLDG